jgi:Rrf2 family protein
MKLSTKGRYAVRIVLYIAADRSGKPVNKTEIGAAEDISPAYVEQILTILRGASLVRSHRGIKGGFTLTRDARDVTVADILTATEGPLSIVPCTTGECKRLSECVTSVMWMEANQALIDIFSSTTLEDLMKKAEERQRSGMMFNI